LRQLGGASEQREYLPPIALFTQIRLDASAENTFQPTHPKDMALIEIFNFRHTSWR